LDSMPIGSSLDIKGPLGHIEYTGRGNFMVHGKHKFAKRLAMLAGGSGITPIYQVVQAILKDPEDLTEMHVVYANRSEDDILLREEMDSWAKKHERFKVWYVVQESKREGWEYSVGFITESILKQHVPRASQDTLALACGPPPMVQFAVKPNLEKLGYDVTNNLLLF
jgi:nitrate reductase (NAD(P)H)